MRKFSEYIGSQFGNPRGIVGKLCCVIMNVMNKALYRKIITTIKLTENSTVLDVGYGNGYLIEKLYKHFKAYFYGIDISKDMLNIATERNRKAKEDGKLNLQTGNCCQMSFSDNSFDTVTSVNTVYFWDDTMQGLKEIYRVLKPTGTFYNVVYTNAWLKKFPYTKTGFKFIEPQEFVAFGQKAGFSEVNIIDIVKGTSYMIVFRK